MQHHNPHRYNQTVQYVHELMQNKSKYLILDTETTGIGRNDVIIEIAVIDFDANILLNTRIKPTKRKRMSPEATKVHGIRMKDLEDAPTFDDIYDELAEIVKDKVVLIYNDEFDRKMLQQTCAQDGLPYFLINTLDVMDWYATYIGEWNEHRGNYRWQKLPNSDHSALGDCFATRKVVEIIEKSQLIETLYNRSINSIPLFKTQGVVPRPIWSDANGIFNYTFHWIRFWLKI